MSEAQWIEMSVRHPSPLSWVPARGRATRHGYERVATHARLRAVVRDALVPLDRRGGADLAEDLFDRQAWSHGGATWVHPLPDGPLGRDAFLAALADPAGGGLAAFAGTPLLARVAPGVPGAPGTPIEVLAPRAVAHRNIDGAAAALVRFLSDDVLLTETHVLVRATPAIQVWTHVDEPVAVLVRSAAAVRLDRAPPVRPDRVADVLGAFPAAHGREPAPAALVGLAALLPVPDGDDSDAIALANGLPGSILALARAASGMATSDGPGCRERIAAASAGVVPDALLGAMGGLRGAAAAAALDRTLALYDAIAGAVRCRADSLVVGASRLAGHVAYADGPLSTRLGSSSRADRLAADADHIAGLAP